MVAWFSLATFLLARVHQPAGRRHHDVHGLVQAHDVVLERRTAGRHHHLHAEVLAELFAHLARLQRQLSSRDEQNRLDGVFRDIHLLQHGDGERGGLAGAVLGARQDIAPSQRDGNRLLLDGRRALEPLLEDAHQELAFQKVILEFVSFRRRDILHGAGATRT